MSNLTGNMALTIWDQITDDFDYVQLMDNWIAVDDHDHSSGRGVLINTNGIANDAITNALLADDSVGNAQLQNNSVETSNIQAGAVGPTQLAANAVTSAAIASGTINYTDLDPNVIPLGTVQLWWRPAGSSATPGGNWEIMDGRPWSGITNAFGLHSGNIPDMRGQFTQGADILGVHGPGVGVTGGSDTINLAHTHAVTAHAHGIPAHIHGISTDGSHIHSWQGGRAVWSRENAISPNVSALEGFGGSAVPVTFYSLYIKNLTSYPPFGGSTDAETDMDPAGAHNHGGSTGAGGQGGTQLATAATDSQLSSSQNIQPGNTALVFIMRVR